MVVAPRFKNLTSWIYLFFWEMRSFPQNPSDKGAEAISQGRRRKGSHTCASGCRWKDIGGSSHRRWGAMEQTSSYKPCNNSPRTSRTRWWSCKYSTDTIKKCIRPGRRCDKNAQRCSEKCKKEAEAREFAEQRAGSAEECATIQENAAATATKKAETSRREAEGIETNCEAATERVREIEDRAKRRGADRSTFKVFSGSGAKRSRWGRSIDCRAQKSPDGLRGGTRNLEEERNR